MSRHRRPVQSWVSETADRSSLWESFLHFLLSLVVLVKKVKEFLSSELPEEDLDDFYDSFATLSLGDPADGREATPQTAGSRRTPSYSPTLHILTPMLPDEVIHDHLWHALNCPPSISLLRRLRGLNRAWRDYLGTTLEWTALEFTRMDTPGYARFIARHQQTTGQQLRYSTQGERFKMEIGHFRAVLEEPLFPVHDLQWCIGSDRDLETAC